MPTVSVPPACAVPVTSAAVRAAPNTAKIGLKINAKLPLTVQSEDAGAGYCAMLIGVKS